MEGEDCSVVRVTQFVEQINCSSHCIVHADNSISRAESYEIAKASGRLGRTG